jgi:hypothetical protein
MYSFSHVVAFDRGMFVFDLSVSIFVVGMVRILL